MKNILMLTIAMVFALNVVTVQEAIAGAEGKCKACHDFGSKNKVGPGLAGVFDRKAGGTDFAKYSDALKSGAWVWNEENLRNYLYDGKKAIKELTGDDGAKTKMPPQKLKGAKMDEVIAFLKGLK